MLDEKETIEYIRRAKGGDQTAKQALIDGNVSLIKCIVKRYLGKGVEYDDLFQLACMGFLKALRALTRASACVFPHTPCR